MRLYGDFEYLGFEEIRGKKDPSKTFFNVLLMQGTEVKKVFVDAGVFAKCFHGIKKMDAVSCCLDVNIGYDKTYVNVLDVKKVEKIA